MTWTLLAEAFPYRLSALTLATFVIAAMAATTLAGIAFWIAGGVVLGPTFTSSLNHPDVMLAAQQRRYRTRLYAAVSGSLSG